MSPVEPQVESESSAAWSPYEPSALSPWNLRRVVHLHRRAGLAATWSELQRDLESGHTASIDRLLGGTLGDDHRAAEFERLAELIGESAARSRQPTRLKAWWVFRMLFTPDPLGERLALLWHNHFATSNRKVNDLPMMRRQNQLFREFGRGRFGELLSAVVRDPAMLVWLDAPANHKGHPNENLARELMELFSLGIGNYGEQDIKEAARALTGWTVVDGKFAFKAGLHDEGPKSFIGQRGAWRGDDIVAMVLEHPATAKRLAWRLCQEFFGEGVATAEHIGSLARLLAASELSIDRAVSVILRSKLFHSETNIRSRVASPVEFVIGMMRAFEQLKPPPSTYELADWIARLGQDLFYPPNVGGWNGGRDWLRTGALIGRSNFAVAVATGRFCDSKQAANWTAFAKRNKQDEDLPGFLGFVSKLLFGGEPSVGWVEQLRRAIREQSSGKSELNSAVAAAISSPEAQLN